MASFISTDAVALRILMTDDLYRLNDYNQPNELPIETIHNLAATVEQEPIYFNYLGENNKYTLLLINETEQEYLNSAHMESLESILKAKKQEIRDVALLNLHRYPNAKFKDLKAFLACTKIVLFGINPSEIGLSNITANVIITHNDVKILATYSFDEMKADNTKKTLFWNEMKKL